MQIPDSRFQFLMQIPNSRLQFLMQIPNSGLQRIWIKEVEDYLFEVVAAAAAVFAAFWICDQ